MPQMRGAREGATGVGKLANFSQWLKANSAAV